VRSRSSARTRANRDLPLFARRAGQSHLLTPARSGWPARRGTFDQERGLAGPDRPTVFFHLTPPSAPRTHVLDAEIIPVSSLRDGQTTTSPAHMKDVHRPTRPCARRLPAPARNSLSPLLAHLAASQSCCWSVSKQCPHGNIHSKHAPPNTRQQPYFARQRVARPPQKISAPIHLFPLQQTPAKIPLISSSCRRPRSLLQPRTPLLSCSVYRSSRAAPCGRTNLSSFGMLMR